MSGQAALLFISGPLAGKGKKIKNEITIIGRSSSCDICIADASISREHAKIIVENGVFSIKDLGSHNGIKVDDKKLDQLVLKNGMRFRLGAAEIEFWDGVGAPPITQQEFKTPMQAEAIPGDFISSNKAPGSNIDELRHKRITNIVILCSILAMALILGISLFVLMNKKERPVHYKFVEMYTNEELIVDLSFRPFGTSEKFLTPFVVNDYFDFTTVFKNIHLDHDIFIIKSKDLIAPPISNALMIRTKHKAGQGEITFYIKEGENRKKIGVLKIEVIRRPEAGVVEKYINTDLETKISIAEDMYQQFLKYENDVNKIKESWELLRNGKRLFENGDAKPEIYSKIDKKYAELNKTIERNNKQLFVQFDFEVDKGDFDKGAKTLERIMKINPDKENLYYQKAGIMTRRLKPRLK